MEDIGLMEVALTEVVTEGRVRQLGMVATCKVVQIGMVAKVETAPVAVSVNTCPKIGC